jgi:integrase
MTTALDAPTLSARDLALRTLVEDAERLARAARAPATQKAYRSDWTHFAAWCARHGLVALPSAPETIGLYIAANAETLAVATIGRRLSSIATAHRIAGFSFDTKAAAIKDVLAGLKRAKGTAQNHAEPLTTDLIKRLAATCGPEKRIDIRDRAILLVGFAGAFRRSEIVALDLADIGVTDKGLTIVLRRSKSDQDGAGQVVAIGRTNSATCPVAAYERWLEAAAIVEGRAFRSINRHGHIGDGLAPLAVSELVKKRGQMAGLNPVGLSGHSLRAGLATSAATSGVEEREIMRQTRHTGVAMVRRYIRDGELFRRNLSVEVGL